MTRANDVLVIGGGIIGIATAYYLIKEGRSVTLLEKNALGTGSSYGNAGLIANGLALPTPAPGVLQQGLRWMLDAEGPFYIKPRLNLELIRWIWQFRGACNEKQMLKSIPVLLALGQGTLDLFDELLADEVVDFGYAHNGRLLLFTDESAFQNSVLDANLLREYGVESRVLDAAGVRQIEANVQDAVQYGIYFNNYSHIIPDRFVHELARVAVANGVTIETKTAVSAFQTTGKKITGVETTAGTYSAKEIVLAAGAWSPLLARQLNLRIPIQPAKGYSITCKRPFTAPSLPLSLSEPHIAVTPMGDKLRLTSTLELAGYDPSINKRRVAAIQRHARNYLPNMETLEETAVWSGYRPSTPDDLPMIGRSNRFENLILATGHGTLGMTHSLITGKLVSEIIGEKRPSLNITPLDPARFR